LVGSLARKSLMKNGQSSLRKPETVKLSVTIKGRLEHKYGPKLKQIDAAIQAWIKADAKKHSICTVHVAVDDSAAMLRVWRDHFPEAPRVRPVSGRITAPKIKRVIDHLWKRLNPEYLVLFGGHDIVPMFEVLNPAFGQGVGESEDKDEKVRTDNPYASSLPFRSLKRRSYLVADRVIGRIPDMAPGKVNRSAEASGGTESDPGWFVDYLKTAKNWQSRPRRFYARSSYAICSQEFKDPARQCMRFIGRPESDLLTSPPTMDRSKPSQHRISARLHLIKCHGNQLDPNFWGNGKRWVKAVRSATLKTHLKRNTVVGTMCCYGAQIYPPSDPNTRYRGQWPMASTYLRNGALGFVGSTMMAWVGPDTMMYADYVAGGYLKYVLQGASIGRAFLDSKMNYVGAILQQGNALDLGDEKTLIEYILLGDPSIHPVTSQHPSALAAEERRLRRVVRQRLAHGLRTLLPERRPISLAKRSIAKKVFEQAHSTLGRNVRKELAKFKMKPSAARVEKLRMALEAPGEARQSLEYYWRGRHDRGGQKQVCVLKAETDLNGNLCRTAVLHSS
jgi:hypothetical protein